MRRSTGYAAVPSGWKSLYDTVMPRQPILSARIAIVPAVLFIGCAMNGCSGGGGSYPSLASRPVERLNYAAPPVGRDSLHPAAPVPSATPSADLAARLAELVKQAKGARRDFAGQQAGAERLVGAAGAAPTGTEAWARATQVLSAMESARSLTAQPLADLDRLEIDDRLAHRARIGPDGDQPSRPDAAAIAQARTTVATLVTEEDTILARLDGRLAR